MWAALQKALPEAAGEGQAVQVLPHAAALSATQAPPASPPPQATVPVSQTQAFPLRTYPASQVKSHAPAAALQKGAAWAGATQASHA